MCTSSYYISSFRRSIESHHLSMQSLVSPLHNSPPPARTYSRHITPLREYNPPRMHPSPPPVLYATPHIYIRNLTDHPSLSNPMAIVRMHVNEITLRGRPLHMMRGRLPQRTYITVLSAQSLSYSGSSDECENYLFAQYLDYRTSPPPFHPFPTY